MLKKKVRNSADKNYLLTRFKTIEGQIHGIAKMVEEDRYCRDILIQISAVSKSLKSVECDILKNHLSTCVVKDIQNNDLSIIDEVIDLIRRLD